MIPCRVYLNIILVHDTPQRVSIQHLGEWHPTELPIMHLVNCIPRSIPRLAPTFRLFFYAHDSAHSVLLCVVIIFNSTSSSAPALILLKGGYTTFWQMIPRRVYLCVIKAIGTPQRVPRLAPTFTIVFMALERTLSCPSICNYYFQRYLIECA